MVQTQAGCRRFDCTTFLSLTFGTIISSIFATLADSRLRQQVVARQSVEQMLYVNQIWLADRERATGNLYRANEVLDACDHRLRGWEWCFLKNRSRVERQRIELEGRHVHALAFSPDGRVLLCPPPR